MNVAIMGHGVVGSGVAEIFYTNPKTIAQRTGEAIEAGGPGQSICRSLYKRF